MEELYQAIEAKIREYGYEGPVNGMDIYNEICDQIEDKDTGSYIFMSKKDDDIVFEYKVDIMEDNFNLSYMDIITKEKTYHIDFDA